MPSTITEVKTPQSSCRFACDWTDITPPIGIYHRMWGAARHDKATGIHRPLRVTVAVFESASGNANAPEQRQVIIAFDHCLFGAAEHEMIVSHIAEVSGLPRQCLLIVCSHTHAAGLMSLDRASLPGGEMIPDYLKRMAHSAGDLVKTVSARVEPTDIVYGEGTCALAAHRDFFDTEKAQFVCGYNPGTPADNTVLVARMTNQDAKTVATLVNYACHPTTLAWENTKISPDYIGQLRETIEAKTGAPCLFLQGASGELGPREGYLGDTRIADRNGDELAYAALATLTPLPQFGTTFKYQGPVVSGATLGSWGHEPLPQSELERKGDWKVHRWQEALRYRPGLPTLDQIKQDLEEFSLAEETARAAGDHQRASESRAMAERKRRLAARLGQLPPGDAFPLNVTIWKMGDSVWVGVQGESYSILQTELRKRFPDKAIVVATIAVHWGAAYLPPKDAYGKGIYQETVAVVAPGSLEHLIESIARQVQTISL